MLDSQTYRAQDRTVTQQQEVRNRRVFYIPGYDPFPPRRYRELYRSEGETQAEISGYEIDLAARHGAPLYGWQATGRIDGAETHAEIDVLQWTDIVKDSMGQSIPATYWTMLRTAWIYVTSGTMRRLIWLGKGPVIAAFYPVVMLCAQLILAVVAGAVLGGLASWLVRALLGLVSSGAWVSVAGYAIWWALFLAVITAGLRFFRKIDHKLFAYYLMHDFAYTAKGNGAYPPELSARIEAFGDTIADALASDVDEVLVVGHSSGAFLGVSILANLIRAGRVKETGPALGFLTLGEVIPMISFLPKAGKLRADLHDLSKAHELTWIDISAPGDGCAFALCDPVTVSGAEPKEGKRWPLVVSAAFSQTMSEEKRETLKFRFFRLHFQYLCAFDQPGDYDYFKITAGPTTLATRYRGRKPSMNRIDIPASKYTSMTP